MKVVLLQDIKGIGKRGELKDVADGYYRNFLLPKQMAVPPEDRRAAEAQAQVKAKVAQATAEIEHIKAMARQFEGRSVVIKAKASGQKLFGAIHAGQVAEALGIEKKLVTMEPIKSLGTHHVTLKFDHGIKSQVSVNVEAA